MRRPWSRFLRPMSTAAHRAIGGVLLVFALISAAFGWAMRDVMLFGGVFYFFAVYLGLQAIGFLLTRGD